MQFLRTLLALFLLLFTGEFCVAQSWDWVVGTSNATTSTLTYVTDNGDIYIIRNNESVLTSSSDSILSSGETLTKIDKTGKRISGGRIDINDFRGYTNFTSIYVKDNIIYALLLANAEISIAGKTFPSAGSNMSTYNFILIKFDADCKVLDAFLLGRKKGYYAAKIAVDNNKDIYVSTKISNASGGVGFDFFEIDPNISFNSNNGKLSTLLLKYSNTGSPLWQKEFKEKDVWQPYQLDPPTIDNAGNLWLFTNSKPMILSYLNPKGDIIKNVQIGGDDFNFGFPYNGRSLYLSPYGDIYICGSVRNKFLLPNGESIDLKGTNSAGIIFKLNNNLQLEWYKIIESNETIITITSCITNKKDEIFLSGWLYSPEKITTPVAFGDINIVGAINRSQFFIRADKNGNGKWIDYLKNSLSSMNYPHISHRDDCDNIYFSGNTDNEIGPGVGDTFYNKTSIGQHSIYNRNDLGGYYFAKLNADTLTFEAKKNCLNIQLINTSDKKIYKTFEWTFPDGTKKTGNNIILDTKEDTDTILVTLKGIKKDGCINITTQKIGIPSLPKPIAYFTTDSFTGCQWVGMKFYDSSYTETDKEIEPSWKWDFGDGEYSTDKNPTHIFTKTGNYNITLIYCNGSKSDTFTLPKEIEIIEAPKPGINTNDTLGCIPFEVKTSYNPTSPVTQYFYLSSDGQTSNQQSPTFIYTKPGKYFITQSLKGPTGCITKDSIEINVHVGYSQSTEPEILTATVTDSNFVRVSWKKNDVTANYKLIRQTINSTKTFHFQSNDTFYIDKNVDVNKAFYSYTLYGTDSCGNTKQSTNKAQTILLENHSQTTEYNYLRWSPYQDWKNGVHEYKLQYKTDSQFVELAKLPGHINEYKDAQLYPSVTKKICYKIIATENGGNNQQSQSNTVCMNFLPTIIVPNAFSPNNDSINDVFSFSAIGIESYELTIYNRWGEKIYSGTEKDKGWDGKFKNALSPEGVYLYKLSAKPYVGKTIHQRGNLHLLR